MEHGFGNPAPAPLVHAALRPAARYLVLIEAAGPVLAMLFTETRELAADFDAGAEEVALMTQGLRPVVGASGSEWDKALAGHSAAERAAAEVFTLDV
ncbi:MAG TPA: hypothetical protein VFQ20_13905 [Burkholderiaceae bacterium]|nr:hypothetical protein [Burkholderiaceae bacterium]